MCIEQPVWPKQDLFVALCMWMYVFVMLLHWNCIAIFSWILIFLVVIGYFFNTSGKKGILKHFLFLFIFYQRMQVCLPLGPRHRRHGRGQSGPWPPGWGRWRPTRTHCGRRIHSLASGWWGRMLRPWHLGNGHPSGCKVSDWKERQTDRKITEGFCPPVTLIDV